MLHLVVAFERVIYGLETAARRLLMWGLTWWARSRRTSPRTTPATLQSSRVCANAQMTCAQHLSRMHRSSRAVFVCAYACSCHRRDATRATSPRCHVLCLPSCCCETGAGCCQSICTRCTAVVLVSACIPCIAPGASPLPSADNVGDNVGDIAGMGSDLFGSLAESTCAALVVSSVSSLGEHHNWVRSHTTRLPS